MQWSGLVECQISRDDFPLSVYIARGVCNFPLLYARMLRLVVQGCVQGVCAICNFPLLYARMLRLVVQCKGCVQSPFVCSHASASSTVHRIFIMYVFNIEIRLLASCQARHCHFMASCQQHTHPQMEGYSAPVDCVWCVLWQLASRVANSISETSPVPSLFISPTTFDSV